MSVPVEPAVAAGMAGASGVDALIAAELSALAADAHALQQLVSVGDVVSATVLPSNGLGDLLNVLGNRVAAALPPTLVPGDVITAQVTGFNGTQILLQVLATNEPDSTSSGAAPAPLPSGGSAAEPAASDAPGTIPGAAGTTLVTPAFGGIEARLAAARAAAVTVVAPSATRTGPMPLPAPSPASPFVAPPPIAMARFVDAPARTVAVYQDPVNLVRALQLPVTPTNVAAAQLALSSPQRLPAALATLERALPQSDDPRVATYRTIAAFIGKIEPASPHLATQIAAYVEHVVAGSEPALAQLLTARATAGAASLPAQPPAMPATPAAPAAEPSSPSVALAQIVERGANIATSLKEQLFSMLAGAPANAGDDVLPAAASALTAVTAVQLSAAQAAAASPATISFAIPMYLGASGYAQARVAVDREAPEGPNVALDGDNFHIAFILDTKHLGTVAIDLRTVGRAFSLSVKTENVRSAQRFGDELSRLTDRLSTLRYRAASVEAVVAAPAVAAPATIAPSVATAAAPHPAERGVNERA